MGAGFESITIVDLDLPRTTWSRVHSSMRTLYLKLSREPDSGWVRFFHEERESRVVIKRHGLWIEEGYIVFDCLLEDVEPIHLPDFRQSVDYANTKYGELVEARREEIEQTRREALAEQLELAALRGRIRGKEEISPPLLAPVEDSRPASIQDSEAAPVEVSNIPAVNPSSETDTADAEMEEFNARRSEWRTRFRNALALASRKKEPDRGND